MYFYEFRIYGIYTEYFIRSYIFIQLWFENLVELYIFSDIGMIQHKPILYGWEKKDREKVREKVN